jgi:hypothetical protein
MPDQTDPHFEEWQQAREVISNVDTNLDALRKVGITFVSTLLTASAFLLPEGSPGSDAPLPIPIKFAVLLITFVLLVALAFIDRNYNVLQHAAATRAIVLERELDLELTEDISVRYAQEKVAWVFHAVYVMIGAAALILGIFVLWPDPLYVLPLGVAWFIYSVGVFSINETLKHEGVDWSVDRTDLVSGDVLHLTATNLNGEADWFQRRGHRDYPATHKFSLAPGHVYWEVQHDPDSTSRVGKGHDNAATSGGPPDGRYGRVLLKGTVGYAITLGYYGEYVWAIDTRDLPSPSVLTIVPTQPKGRIGRPDWAAWDSPLPGKIRLSPKPRAEPGPPSGGAPPQHSQTWTPSNTLTIYK